VSKEFLSDFWERNRSFLTPILAGAAVFLVLAYIALSFGSESEAQRRRRRALMARVSALQRRVVDSGGLSQETVAEAEKELADRIAKLCVPVPTDLERQGAEMPTRFIAAKEELCARLTRLASQEGVQLQQNLSSVDFHQRETDDALRYAAHWATLRCFERLLEAAIRARFSQVLSVVCEPEAVVPIPGDRKWGLARAGITVQLSGSYDSVLKLFKEVLQPGRFVDLELVSLRTAPQRAESGGLLAKVTGWGMRLVPMEKYRRKAGESTPFFRRFKR